MRGERQMNKNSQRLEDGASGSPYINRCGEYTIEVEFAGSSSCLLYTSPSPRDA